MRVQTETLGGQVVPIHMVGISSGGYFFKKLSLFSKLKRLFAGTFGVESRVSNSSRGQSYRVQSEKVIFGPTTSG